MTTTVLDHGQKDLPPSTSKMTYLPKHHPFAANPGTIYATTPDPWVVSGTMPSRVDEVSSIGNHLPSKSSIQVTESVNTTFVVVLFVNI